MLVNIDKIKDFLVAGLREKTPFDDGNTKALSLVMERYIEDRIKEYVELRQDDGTKKRDERWEKKLERAKGMCELRAKGLSFKEIGVQFGVSAGRVAQIIPWYEMVLEREKEQ